MNERIKELAEQAGWMMSDELDGFNNRLERFTELIVKECVEKIETHQIPVGNSSAGEMACEWTYAALKEIRDEIKEHFGMK